MTNAEKAVNNHKNFFSCSASVLCAFCDEAGLTAQEAKTASMPFAGGKIGKCGAVLAAEYVIDRKFGDRSDELKQRFEHEFTEMNRSVVCKELKGSLTGKPLRSCRGCVTDAAELLDKLINEETV